jgi:nucleoside-diphosphate-sugar epimerase
LFVLGGTWFVGRALAEAAVAGGWEVTCFNRGRTGRDVAGVESVRGDRTIRDDVERLARLAGWDAVVENGGV